VSDQRFTGSRPAIQREWRSTEKIEHRVTFTGFQPGRYPSGRCQRYGAISLSIDAGPHDPGS